MSRFRSAASFAAPSAYQLLPIRFRRLPWDHNRAFVSSMAGDWLLMQMEDVQRLVTQQLPTESSLFADLEARHLVVAGTDRSSLAPLLSQIRSRKSYLVGGPALHIFVVSLRCHHTCNYCQVSRQETSAAAFDMERMHAEQAVERLFEWPSKELTIEFQGGEPLLNFDQVMAITRRIVERNRIAGRTLRFVLASTLHDLTDAQLDFLSEYRFKLSTSLDGPEWLHNTNRPRPGRDSYRRTVHGIERGRRWLGDDGVSALTTLTRQSLEVPEAIIDEYRKLGFHNISLRPLSPYGFATKTARRTGYPTEDFLAFYQRAFDHLVLVNSAGYAMDESYASLLLSQLFTSFGHGYVDLRSPSGAGLGAVIYDHDGRVYPSDEARMLAAMGDDSFALGHVSQSVSQWLSSSAMARLLDAGVAEALPTCSDCAFVPMCGADPIEHYARQGDPVGHRPSSDFCRRNMGLFDFLLERYENAGPDVQGLMRSWATPKLPVEMEDAPHAAA